MNSASAWSESVPRFPSLFFYYVHFILERHGFSRMCLHHVYLKIMYLFGPGLRFQSNLK